MKKKWRMENGEIKELAGSGTPLSACLCERCAVVAQTAFGGGAIKKNLKTRKANKIMIKQYLS